MSEPSELPRRLGARWPLGLLALLVVAIDQASKLGVRASLRLHEVVEVIPGFFNLTHSANTGGVWGMGRDLPEPARLAVFLALPALITGFAIWYSLQLPPDQRLRQGAIAIVIGGAIGNLLDRLVFRKVTDFLLFHVKEHYWPTFNLADTAICLGIGVLVVLTFLDPEEPEAAVAAP